MPSKSQVFTGQDTGPGIRRALCALGALGDWLEPQA